MKLPFFLAFSMAYMAHTTLAAIRIMPLGASIVGAPVNFPAHLSRCTVPSPDHTPIKRNTLATPQFPMTHTNTPSGLLARQPLEELDQ